MEGNIFYVIVFFIKNQWELLLKWIKKLRDNDGYKELGPTSEATNVGDYEKALLWAISNKDVKNIAITAPYGAGKTSVINTFFSNHHRIKHINVSLAMFKDIEDNKIITIPQSEAASELLNADLSQKDNTEISIKRLISDECEDELEEAILEQLLYHVKKDRIPLSQYNKVTSKFNLKKILAVCVIIYSIVFGAYFINPTIIKNYFEEKMAWLNGFKLYPKIGIILSMILCGCTLYLIIHKVLSFISEIELGNDKFGKVVIDKDKSLTPFKRNLDEIVYFFKKTKYRTIVFEDMDRFENPRIFVKLRELNYLLNNYEGINRKIVFIYALRDDVFTNKDRTKFFDFIIPVVPYISTLNGYACLRKRFEEIEGENVKDFEELFLSVKPFLDDMRVLNNIGNEYSLYKKIINHDDSPEAKREILALVIVKNLYPSVFTGIQKDGGVLKTIIDKVNKSIEEEKSELQVKIEEKQKKIEEAKALSPINREILKDSIIYSLERMVGNHVIVAINFGADGNKNITEIYSDDNVFEKLLEAKSIDVYYKIPYGYSNEKIESMTISNFNEKTIGDKKYIDCWSEIAYAERIKIATLEDEITECNNKINEFKGDPFDIYNLFLEKAEIKEEKEKCPVLFSLIENKYIDRNYSNYINYFEPGELTIEENDFIKSVRSRNGAENWDVKISDVTKIMKELIPSDYTHIEILNYDFLTFLLSAEDVDDKLKSVFKLLKNHGNIKYIIKYVERDNEHNKCLFINKYLNENTGFWDDVIGSNLMDSVKILLIRLIISYADITAIEETNRDAAFFGNDLDALINENRILINDLNEVENGRLIDVFNCTEVSINDLSIIEDDELANLAWENELFDINYSNLKWYVESHLSVNKVHAVISTLFEESIKSYLINQVPKWGEILSNKEDKDESIEIISYYLDNVVGTENFKIEEIDTIIDNQNTETGSINELIKKVDFANEIHKDQWRQIFGEFIRRGKLSKTWLNVQTYISAYEVDYIIVDFINENIDVLEKTEPAEDLTYNAIVDESLTDKAINAILKNHLGALVNTAGASPYTAHNERVTLEFIKQKAFDYDEDRYGDIMQNDDLKIAYIESYSENIDKILDYNPLEEADYNLIVKSSLSDEQKNYCFNEYDFNSISDEVYEYLKDRHVDNDHLAELLWKKAPNEDKLKILVNYFEELYVNIETYLLIMGDEYLSLQRKTRGHKARIENNELNRKLMNLLKEKKYIKEFCSSAEDDSKLDVKVSGNAK